MRSSISWALLVRSLSGDNKMAEMRPIELHDDVVKALWALYQEAYPHLPDIERSFAAFQSIMFDQYTQIFRGPGNIVILLRDMYLPDGNASFHILMPNKWALRKKAEIREGLKHLMELFGTYRLFSSTPSPVVGKMLLHLGFVKEGTLRQVALMNEKRADMNLFSLLKEDFNGKPEDTAASLIEAAGLN